MALYTKEEALAYHSTLPIGKLEVIPIKPCSNAKHLSMAYSPGVAEVCRAIAADPEDSFKYTNRGNLVAVVSNGTAILGLGNLGPKAAKPVMEGKGMLLRPLPISTFMIFASTQKIRMFSFRFAKPLSRPLVPSTSKT